MILSKHIFNFPLNSTLSFPASIFAVCDEADYAMVSLFCNYWLLL